MIPVFWLFAFLALVGTLAYRRTRLTAATAALAAYLALFTLLGRHAPGWDILAWAAFAAVAVVLNNVRLRRRLLSDPAFTRAATAMPAISETERIALDAGTVWWDAELFTGRPDWDNLLDYPAPSLSPEEQAFLDGPCETLCAMVDDWAVTHERLDLPPQAWEYIREQGFFGLIIPAAYGGKGFSAQAHSAVAMKLASRSGDLGSTVMVPNSLGPAELLLRYGTDTQRDYYLPRLARGEEIPCFALTGPLAGSDAGAIPDTGVVCHGEVNGEQVLGLRLNWEKRYITLGPVATLLGLAFRARDPEGLLGGPGELGITLALIPTDTPGVEIGRRHFPLNAAFMNGPNRGHEVFIPLEQVIGGREGIGEGWRMLMNCLSVGRSISLPSAGTAQARMAAWTTGAYARVREQFGLPIGEFEGVQEALARITGNAYVTEAARALTATAVDQGEAPAVLSAVVKYHLTERARASITDAMDVHGGKGICLGPNNYLGRAWQTAPIPITVEGSNILTRNMMIFGQGAIRCHPHVLAEMRALQDGDRAAFDRELFAHAGFTLSNAARSLILGLTGARVAAAPERADATRDEFRALSRYAAAFALCADAAMLSLGGALKRRERLSARLGDVLSLLYLGSATLKRFHDDGSPRSDLPVVRWVMAETLALIEARLDAVMANLPARPLAWLLRGLIFPLGRRRRGPDDALGRTVAAVPMQPGSARDRLLRGIYRSADPAEATGALEDALQRTVAAAPLERRLHDALRAGTLRVDADGDDITAARAAELVDDAEAEKLRTARRARRTVIDVDDFDPGALGKR
ncbi:Acyl-coenzyme A dehydrogenase [wastewater metagenome]|uniref:Acyl-coenzyme A dehydrogenase n=4 Tax=root TaxID=1 RepID=A0A5B8REM3_9ZZZZ|nr:acyl-coenzyme A dehydrogenase [uncultured organism]